MRQTALLLLVLLTGCASAPTTFVPPPPLPLRIDMIPQVAAAYVDHRVYCRLPADVGDGQFVFGITGMFHSEGPIDRIVYDRMIRMPCEEEPLTVYCGYKEHGKPLKQVRMDIHPVGECR